MSATSVTNLLHSKWTVRLEYFTWIVAAFITICLMVEEDVSWIGWIILGIIVCALILARWPYGALLVLIGASAMPVFYVQIAGWKARPEHVAAVLVTLALVFWFALAKRPIRLNTIDYWILGYVAANYISSAFGSLDPSSTLRWALQNNLAVLPYFVVRILVRDLETLEKAFQILLGVALAESAYGILCYASNHIFGTVAGMSIGQYLVDVAAPYGSMYEPNLFGAYAASCAVMFLSLYVTNEHNRFGSLIGCFICSIAAVLSFSRATTFALLVIICFVLWRAPSAELNRRAKLVIVGLGCTLAMAFAFSAVGGVLQQRIADLFVEGMTENTAIARFFVIEQALQEVPHHLWIGSGTASFNLSFDWTAYIPEWASDKTWIGNAPLRILHDTGIVGFTAMSGFFVSLWLMIREKLAKTGRLLPIVLGLTAGLAVYGVSFQFTDGTILAFSWIQLGLLTSAATIANSPIISVGRSARESQPGSLS
jgi:hypothetical protein